MQQSSTAREQGMGLLHSAMNELAQEELFSPLSDEGERQRFINWMSDKDNPQPWKKMDIEKELARKDTLIGAYAAYRAAVRGREETPVHRAPSTDTREKAKLASGGGGTHRAPKSNAPVTELDQFKADLEASKARAFGR
jgi:LmbE family N-acetylglucosaminyl deacetylase